MTTNNIIFMEGKEKALTKLFNNDNFGYLAVGYKENDNGFQNSEEGTIEDKGFNEISNDSTYHRVPLSFNSIIDQDDDNGTVTAKFTAELDLDNIIEPTPINQIAICDSLEKNNSTTTFFAASVVEKTVKSEGMALVYVVMITM